MTPHLIRNLIRRWRSQATREFNIRKKWTNSLSIEKSYGIEIALRQAASDLEKLLKEVERVEDNAR